MPATHEWFDTLVAETKVALGHYLRQYLTSTDDIQDVLQEAYLKVFCVVRAKRDTRHQPSALLYTTARNIAISKLRHRQVVARCEPAVAVSEELRRSTRTAEQKLARSERRRLLLAVVNTLPSKCRQVFSLRMIDGLSQRAIGERLGISVSTVEKHLAKGLRHCKQELAEHVDADAADPPAIQAATP